jgi:hypothetical protein
MGLSYVLMLIAFYVDNGKQLPPLWKDLPHVTYWLLPLAIGIPLIVRALLPPRNFRISFTAAALWCASSNVRDGLLYATCPF